MESAILSKEQLDEACRRLCQHDVETGKEMAILFGKDGTKLNESFGDEEHVETPALKEPIGVGGVLMHNHPDSCGPFSIADLAMLPSNQIREGWVVCQDGSRFKTSGFNDSLSPALTIIIAEMTRADIVRTLIPLHEKGELTKREATRIMAHAYNLKFLANKVVDCYEWSFGAEMKATISKFRELCKKPELAAFAKEVQIESELWG